MPVSESTEPIIKRVLAGDTDAYAEIVNRHQKEVWSVVVALLHDIETSKDLVEQVFVEAYLSLDQFTSGADFSFWIKGIARNVVRAELRKKTRESRRLEIYREHLIARLNTEDEAGSQDSALKDSLAQCREKLPEHSARVLDMRYSQGLSFEEIAGALGKSVEATRQLLSRVRLMLRECIDRSIAQA